MPHPLAYDLIVVGVVQVEYALLPFRRCGGRRGRMAYSGLIGFRLTCRNKRIAEDRRFNIN